MSIFGEKESHPSYGMIGVSRVSCGAGGINLFGSSIRHGNLVRICIKRAEKERHLNTTWYYGKEELVEVYLSATQFADMVMLTNHGDGVPCTIRSVGRESQGECPETAQRETFHREMREDVQKVMANANSLMGKASELLSRKGTLKAAERDELLNLIRQIQREINDNMPFAAKCYDEAMERTETEAKAEVEAFVQTRVTELGLDSLRQLANGANTKLLPHKGEQDEHDGD